MDCGNLGKFKILTLKKLIQVILSGSIDKEEFTYMGTIKIKVVYLIAFFAPYPLLFF